MSQQYDVLAKSVFVMKLRGGVLFLLTLSLAGLTIAAYPRLHRKLLRFQSYRAAEMTTAALGPQLRDGDLIFHTSQSAQSQAIQLATHSPYSHCGIVYKNAGQW